MLVFLFFISAKYYESYKTNLLRRNCQIEIQRSPSLLKIKNIGDSWYFVHFDEDPDFSLLAKQGIEIKSSNMISKRWFSLFLSTNQAQYLSRFASLRAVARTEKIIDWNHIKFSDSIEIETSSTFDPSIDLSKFGKYQPYITKLNSNLYQLTSADNQKLAKLLSSNEKIYSILPKNRTLYSNNRAAGFTQFNTDKPIIAGLSNDTIVLDRHLESKGLTGKGQIVLVEDSYLDPNSTFFYDPQNPLFEKNRLYSDHRKLVYIFEDEVYKKPTANEHGTHVAGCAAGSSHLNKSESDLPLYNGVAPDAKIAFYQGGSSGMFASKNVKKIVEETHPCACSNSWGFRITGMTEDNQWNLNAKEMNDTLFMFSAGNSGVSLNKNLDYYESLDAPGTGKNILTVGALSSIPINEQDDRFKAIYFFEIEAQQTYKPEVKVWSLKKSESIKNPAVDMLFTDGSVEMKMTKKIDQTFKDKLLILVINGKSDFDKINKTDPPLIALTTEDFEVENFESIGFSHLFPILYLDNETLDVIYNAYSQRIEVESNFVDSKMIKLHRAPFSSKGPSEIGLIKPEIVAPGTTYFSARSDPKGGFGHADFAMMDGTSMATPNVAGATALVAQYFVDKKYRSSKSLKPSSSLLRSVLINAADPLDDEKVSPDVDVGFGSLNLGKYILTSVSDQGNDENVLVADKVDIQHNQHLVSYVEIKDNSRDFRVTLSYLDEIVSSDSAAALMVDLDLVVVGPDETVYRGNQRADNTEESYSTNERVVIKKDNVKPGKYEIHVFASIPEIVPNRLSQFSVSIFGSLSDSTKEAAVFETAKKCIPVVDGNGECNQETALNDCKSDDYEIFTGHSCQIEIMPIIENNDKKIFELEPFGVKYLSFFYPFDAVFSNLTISISSATEFHPKYVYTLNTSDLKLPLKEIEADNIINGDLTLIIKNYGQAVQWEVKSCAHIMIYNKSPKKTLFIANFKIAVEPEPEPTEEPETPDTPSTSETSSSSSSIPSASETPSSIPSASESSSSSSSSIPSTSETSLEPSLSPTEMPTKSNDASEKDKKNEKFYFISITAAFASCVIMFIIIIILAIIILKTKKESDPRSEMAGETLKTPLL
ncbi:hypothetical protein M9Y10_016018 [Tritrichomonas musculus]|uniref:Peptidase S8/S53 domain-containing protein n=1 Tax=Tritrichomonas musculus TaxID=1915356 RepID=A0ABR2I6H5_9EUKA